MVKWGTEDLAGRLYAEQMQEMAEAFQLVSVALAWLMIRTGNPLLRLTPATLPILTAYRLVLNQLPDGAIEIEAQRKE